MTFKRILWWCIGIIILSLILWPKLKPTQKGDMPGKSGGKGMPIKVGVFVAKTSESAESIQVNGNILAMEEVALKSETQGRVVKIGFKEGSDVTKGQLLVKINDAELKAQLARAQATLKLKSDTEKRNKQLLEKGAVSQEMYDQSFTELTATTADIDLIKEQIRKTEIIAPFSGVIGLRYISEGSYVTNATPIASLHTLNKVKVEFSVPEKYASRIKIGNRITFQIDGNDQIFTARIYAFEPSVDAATRNVMMRAECENVNHALIPGAFANIKIDLSHNKNVLVVPTQSIVPVLKGQKVFVVQGDSAVEKKVRVGARGDQYIEVKEGLSVGDSVIVSGVMYVRQGSKVIVKK